MTALSSRPFLSLPTPRVPVSVRPATARDLPFIDALQKKQSKQVGFMHAATLRGKLDLGHVLIAETGNLKPECPETADPEFRFQRSGFSALAGYLIGCDRYFKRDDVGVVYQINVEPGHRRSFVAAALLAAQFERSAYGCRLYCCWCAQDIEANRFWEAMGFVPLAFRTGSRTRGAKGTPRVHVFWQKRIRAGDDSTPWWFPSQTDGGSLREGRIVLPIPPGTHWSEAVPLVLPGMGDSAAAESTPKRRAAKPKAIAPPVPTTIRSGGLRFAAPAPDPVAVPAEKPKREPKVREKNDPRLVAAARELRDRWLEKIEEEPWLLESAGKYDVRRSLPDRADDAASVKLLSPAPQRQLPAAA